MSIASPCNLPLPRRSLRGVGIAVVALAALGLPTALVVTSIVMPMPVWAQPREGKDSSKDAPAAKAALTVTTVAPQRSTLAQTLAANGSVAAWQETIIGAETQGLRLVEVAAQVGDRVKRGQVLARLSSETLSADVEATRANLAEAVAAVEEAAANAERARQLQSSGAISTQQIQQFTTLEATARARAQALRARLRADQVRLAQTRIVAPDDGVISARGATVGAVAQPGQELFRLIRAGRLEWRAEVPATELARLTPGTVARVTPAGGEAVQGTVRMVAPTVDAATRNGIVYVDLPQPGSARAGMFARGEFEFGTSQGLTLPQSAVLLRDGFSYVLKVDGDSKTRLVKVTTGRRVADRVEIVSGLDAQSNVVASGAGFLSDGDTVRVVNAAAPAATVTAPATTAPAKPAPPSAPPSAPAPSR
jgi:HlyD family secretion protein